MIKDIAGKEDFDAIGIALLEQPPETATLLLVKLDEARQHMDPEDENYWQSASTKLATALAIAHREAEFLLKGASQRSALCY